MTTNPLQLRGIFAILLAMFFSFAIDPPRAAAAGLEKSNLGAAVNTSQAEFHPVLAPDGRQLYFARNCGSCEGGEDIFVSRRDGEEWQPAIRLGPPLSTRGHEMPTGISADGRTLLLYGSYPGGLGRGDIYYSELTSGCWSAPKPYPAPINSPYFDSDATVSADARAVLLVSDRPGGTGEFHAKGEFFHGSLGGNTDIYAYVETAAGTHELINLGPTINTPYSEYSPFLAADGRTLYFSSDGHGGLGGLDIYKSTRLREGSWTEWSEPVNLGREINGAYNDWGFQVSAAGDVAVFASADAAGGYGASDIYSIAMPAASVRVFGKVTDPAGQPLAAAIRLNDLEQIRLADESSSDAATGEYAILLPLGHQYSISAEKEGYIGSSAGLDLRETREAAEHRLDFTLYPAGQLDGVTIRCNNIFFDFDKAELRPASSLELDRWVELFKKNQELTAEIHGHTDSIGTAAYNQKLSERRARAVAAYLIHHGVNPVRLAARGFGETRPVAGNNTAEGRQLNRRVEIHFGKGE